MEIAIWLGLLVLFGILEAATVALVSLWFMAGSLAALIAALWSCGLSRERPIPAGTQVRVDRIEGVKLFVTPAEVPAMQTSI